MNETKQKRILQLINYVLVAALASAATLTWGQGLVRKDSKLEELEEVIAKVKWLFKLIRRTTMELRLR